MRPLSQGSKLLRRAIPALAAVLLAIPVQAQRHVWRVPGTQGIRYEGVQWDRATGTLVAAQGDTLVRLDPVRGERTVLHRIRMGDRGGLDQPRVMEVLVDEHGTIDFIQEGKGPGSLDTRIWRRHPDGRVQVIVDLAEQPDGKDAFPWGTHGPRFSPAALAAGPGGERFVADSGGRVLRLLWRGDGSASFLTLATAADLAPKGPRGLGVQGPGALDVAVTGDGTVLTLNPDKLCISLLAPPAAGGPGPWRGGFIPPPGMEGCALAPGSEGLTLGVRGTRLAAGEDGRIYTLCASQIWAFRRRGTAPGSWTAEAVAGFLRPCANTDVWPVSGASAEILGDGVMTWVRHLATVPGGGLLLSGDGDGIHFIGPEDDAALAEQVRECRREGRPGDLDRIRDGLAGDPGVRAFRAAMALAAIRAEAADAPDALPPYLAQRHLWTVPGTEGEPFKDLAWDSRTATIVAAQDDEIIRIDPLGGGRIVLHDTSTGPADADSGPAVTTLALRGDGAIDFTQEGDGVVRRLGRNGKVQVLAGQAGAGKGRVNGQEAQEAKEAPFQPTHLAAGSGDDLWVADADQHRVLRLVPGAPGSSRIEVIAGLSAEQRAALTDEEVDAACASSLEDPAKVWLDPVDLAVGPGGEVLVVDKEREDLFLLTPSPESGGGWRLRVVPRSDDWGSPKLVHPVWGYGLRVAFPNLAALGEDGTLLVASSDLVWACRRLPQPQGGTLWRWEVIAGHLQGMAEKDQPKAWPSQGASAEGLSIAALSEVSDLAPVPGGGLLMSTRGGSGIRFLGPEGDALLAERVRAHRRALAQGDEKRAQAILDALVRQRDPRHQVTRTFRRLNRKGEFSPRLPQDLNMLIGSFLLPDQRPNAFRAAMAIQAILQGAPAGWAPGTGTSGSPAGVATGPAAQAGGGAGGESKAGKPGGKRQRTDGQGQGSGCGS